MSKVCGRLLFLSVIFVALIGVGTTARAAEKSFFEGKSINLYVGYTAGGGFDAFGRLLARYLGKHLPGNPNIIVSNVPGAGSLTLANSLYNVYPKDGTALAIVAPSLPLDEAMGEPNVKFVFSEFTPIGRIGTSGSALVAWHASPVKTIAEAMKTGAPLAATGPSSESAVAPAVLNSLIGTRFKIITGYGGTAQTVLALERGEANFTIVNTSSLTSQFADFVKTKKLDVLAQNSIERDPAFPDTPTFSDLTTDPENKNILKLFAIGADIGRAVIAPPGMDPARVAMLREAFLETMKDPELLAFAAQKNFDLAPLGGQELKKMLQLIKDIPPSQIEKAKRARTSAR